jgi:hypothetical protein
MSPWSFAAASAVGTSHARRALPCQDSSACLLMPTSEDGPVLVGVVADGAGSARRAEVGSRLTCSLTVSAVAALLGNGGTVRDITRGRVEMWLTELQSEVARHAEREHLASREYASTLVAAVVAARYAVFFQVGDGAAVLSLPGPAPAFRWVFWPGTGGLENLTFFATEPHAVSRLKFVLVEGEIDELALFSDGLQRLALQFETRTAHSPFFESVLAPLRGAPVGHSQALSAQLATFLDSPRVNERTDDDKTLILATRRLAGAGGPTGIER